MNTLQNFKKIGRIAIVAMALTVVSCSDDDDNGGGGGNNTGSYVEAKIDGSDFSSVAPLVVSGLAEGNLIIQGALANGTSIAINIFAYDGTLETGTYNVGFNNNSEDFTGSLSYNLFNGTSATVYSSMGCESGTGTVTISAIDGEKVEGTFSFSGKEIEDCSTKGVTDGSFRAIFTN